jgi:hypothetical protein
MGMEDDLSLREKNNIQVHENKVVRKAFRPRKDDVSEFRILHNEIRRNLYRLHITVRIVKYKKKLWAERDM